MLWWLTGCAGYRHLLHQPLPPQLPPQVHLTTVPFFAQAALQCGPASLAMVLQWSGAHARPEDLTPEVYTPGREGSLQSGLIAGARRHQRLAYPIQGWNDLMACLAAGQPVIVLQNLGLSWLPRWHYAVALGYDLNQEVIWLHTGQTADRSVGLATFLRTWQRADQWGLLVLSPGQMPASAQEYPYLQAVQGLSQAGQRDEAIIALQAAAERWPASGAVWMAMGNAFYDVEDKAQALSAFQRAAQLDPGNGAPLNNMAHLLAEQGALEAAQTAAQKAVLLGGPHIAIYRQTLEEIHAELKKKAVME
ncbi:MAG: PA2778 family cysteine peptidase [Desulfobacteraceae bacterium]|nr:PA2778 family cysteine peptidase [Desulfobacteraceae bacterium]